MREGEEPGTTPGGVGDGAGDGREAGIRRALPVKSIGCDGEVRSRVGLSRLLKI